MNGVWYDVKLADKLVEVYTPPAAKVRFALIFLHPLGLETLRGRTAFTRVLDQLGMPCVCPHAGRSWWVDRVCAEFDASLTPEQHIMQSVLPFVREHWKLEARAVGIFGISMGGQGALRLAFRHPQEFPVVAGIASALDFQEMYGQGKPLDDMYDSKEQARQDTAILHIHQSQQPRHIFFCIDPEDLAWYRGNDRLHEKLSPVGVAHTVDLTTEAGGHSWQYFDTMAERTLRFLHDGLVDESRRLL